MDSHSISNKRTISLMCLPSMTLSKRLLLVIPLLLVEKRLPFSMTRNTAPLSQFQQFQPIFSGAPAGRRSGRTVSASVFGELGEPQTFGSTFCCVCFSSRACFAFRRNVITHIVEVLVSGWRDRCLLVWF